MKEIGTGLDGRNEDSKRDVTLPEVGLRERMGEDVRETEGLVAFRSRDGCI